jgi:putative hydrolase of the HAD superfamily
MKSPQTDALGSNGNLTGLDQLKIIAFDADDTLWINETFYRDAETQFCELVGEFMTADKAFDILFDTEMRNLGAYGYGIKPFTLSLIEAAIQVSDGQVPIATIEKLLANGKQMLEMPVELLPGIEETLQELSGKYRLVMVTKGDLLDQERKLQKSGLESYFHHIEIVSDKTPRQYLKLVKHLDVEPHEFLMVGNSPKSDILPVLEIGAHAFHIPFHTTWVHEIAEHDVNHPQFKSFKQARDILEWL